MLGAIALSVIFSAATSFDHASLSSYWMDHQISAQCSEWDRRTTGCPEPGTSNDGDGIDVWDEIDVPPGTGDQPGGPGPVAPGQEREGEDSLPGDPPRDHVTDPEELQRCLERLQDARLCFGARPPQVDAEPEDPAEPAPRPITLADLVRFVPTGTTVSAEPGNVGVVGLPANFVSDATAQTTSADLLGRSVTVRFTPVGFDFAYGDGANRATTDPGASWAALGQADFTPTATSHVYGARGEYTATVVVRYAADLDYGLGWIPMGEIAAAPAAQTVRVFEARSALVEGTCEERPGAPGCP